MVRAIATRGDTASARVGARPLALCFLFVFAGFTLTSTTYLAWLYRLTDLLEPDQIEALTLVGGYAFQALGLLVAAVLGQRRRNAFSRMSIVNIVALHFLFAAPAMAGTSMVSVLVFGFLMNLLCGVIAAAYLFRLATDVPAGRRGIVFGGAYACSALASWLLSLIPGMQAAGNPVVFGPCLVLSALTAAAALIPAEAKSRADGAEAGNVKAADAACNDDARTAAGMRPFAIFMRSQPEAGSDRNAAFAEPQPEAELGRSVALTEPQADAAWPNVRMLVSYACLAVLLMSLAKNVGGGFPAGAVVSGVNVELSRLFYAVGLIAAGAVIDRSRKHGLLCCIAALVLPFAFMVLSSEPIPVTVIWGLNYLFTGFFSVFRVVVFADIASETRLLHLAGFGLMMGRVGDALGTAVYLSLGDNTVALLAVALVLFATTVFVSYRLGQILFMPSPLPQRKTEAELLAEFADRYELSQREREVLEQLMAGRSNAEIASELFISESTVKFHMHNLLKKTGSKSRTELRSSVAKD